MLKPELKLAARIDDPVLLPLPIPNPDTLKPGFPSHSGFASPNVYIGGRNAWRGMPHELVTVLRLAKLDQAAFSTTIATAAIVTGLPPDVGVDIHIGKLSGPGVVIDGSATVKINGLPACRSGDTILSLGVDNKIINGCQTVIIND